MCCHLYLGCLLGCVYGAWKWRKWKERRERKRERKEEERRRKEEEERRRKGDEGIPAVVVVAIATLAMEGR